MIIGTRDIRLEDLKEACKSPKELIRFSESLVPLPIKHIPEITMNQKYYVALLVRKIMSLPWDKRNHLCTELLKGVRIKGYPDTLYDYEDILASINIKDFLYYLRKDIEC